MKDFTWTHIRKLFRSHTFIKNFGLLMAILTFLFLSFAMCIFSQSRKLLLKEYSNTNHYQLEECVSSMDNYINDVKFLIASLELNHLVNAFFTYDDPELLYHNYHNQLQSTLLTQVYSAPSVNSIYLYNGRTGWIQSPSAIHVTTQKETEWISGLPQEEGFHFIFRARSDIYPIYITVAKVIHIADSRHIIAVDLKLSELPPMKTFQDSSKVFYIVSDDKASVYCTLYHNLLEDLSSAPVLSNFQESSKAFTVTNTKANPPYVYSQAHSSRFPWSYVLVHQPEEFVSSLTISHTLLMAIVLILFFIVLLISFLVALRTSRPVQELLQMITNPSSTLSAELLNNREISQIAGRIMHYINQNQALSDELADRLELLNHSRLVALQSQINPHFIFNTLETIHMKECEVLGYDHKLPEMTLHLSRLLHYAVRSTDMVSLEQELEFTQMYISLLKESYHDQLQMLSNITPEVLPLRVPKLFLQPLIENAFFHGLSGLQNRIGVLTLHCHMASPDVCQVCITDNGKGMSPEELEALRATLQSPSLPQENIGLKNVVIRMKLLYGDAFFINIDSTEGEGSSFTITFPA